MEKVIYGVLLDFEHLALLTMAMGLLITASIRSMGLQASANSRADFGKVQTHSFGGVDLAAVLLLVAFYYRLVLFGAQQQEELTMSIELIVAGLVMNLFLVMIVLVTVQWVGGRDPIEVFGLKRITFSKCLMWVVLGLLLLVPAMLYSSEWVRSEWLEPIFGEMKEQEVVDSMKNAEGLGLKVGLIVSACIAAPVVEELVFRGYIYGVLKKFTNPLFAMVVAGALFAVVHMNLPALLPLWILAVLLTLSYELSGSLWVPIGIHAGFNTFSVVAMLNGWGDAAP